MFVTPAGRLRREQHRHFSALLGNHALVDSIAHFGTEHKEYTKLVQKYAPIPFYSTSLYINLPDSQQGIDPDEVRPLFS